MYSTDFSRFLSYQVSSFLKKCIFYGIFCNLPPLGLLLFPHSFCSDLPSGDIYWNTAKYKDLDIILQLLSELELKSMMSLSRFKMRSECKVG